MKQRVIFLLGRFPYHLSAYTIEPLKTLKSLALENVELRPVESPSWIL